MFVFIGIAISNKPYVGEQAPTLPDWKFNIVKMRDWERSFKIDNKTIKEKQEINKNW